MNKKTILIVDDSDFDRQLLTRAIASKGNFETLEANGGEQCLGIISEKKIDLILMDILMPGELGSDVLIKIREKYNPIELPVIMVTSKGETSDVVGCLQKGANDYITKPVTFDIAISRISTHLKLAEISREMSRLQEMAALDAMITTYNHEINNPLTIAIGCLNSSSLKDEATVTKIKSALWRVADIVKKIRSVTEKKEAEYQQYAGETKMFNIR